jgi:hypothetical protein
MILSEGPILPFEKPCSSKIIRTCKPYPDQRIDGQQHMRTLLPANSCASNNEVSRVLDPRIVLLSDVRARALISDFFYFDKALECLD